MSDQYTQDLIDLLNSQLQLHMEVLNEIRAYSASILFVTSDEYAQGKASKIIEVILKCENDRGDAIHSFARQKNKFSEYIDQKDK